MSRLLLAFAILSIAALSAHGGGKADKGGKELVRMAVKAAGEKRTALVHFPDAAKKSPSPVVFVFHGHGQTMKIAASDFKIHAHWPDAIVVYMQGLPTVTKSDPKGKEPGWQNSEGDGNRDLAFFDAALAELKSDAMVNPKRIYATGFSNGANFTYLLWAERGGMLAAVAPVAGAAGNKIKKSDPKPCLHIAGLKDDTVDYANQQKSMEAVRQVNGATGKGRLWAKEGKAIDCIEYPAPNGAPFVSAIHGGGHIVPELAGQLISRFFKEN